MKINYFTIYMLLIGWAGVALALGTPFLLSVVPNLTYQSAFYQTLWMVGGLLSVLAGGYIAWDKRNTYGQVAGVFLVIGLGSLSYAVLCQFI